MIVYGDAIRTIAPPALAVEIQDFIARAARLPAGIERHAALVSALIEAGGLAQGIADAEFEGSGLDAPSLARDASMTLVLDLARAVRRSWESGFDNPLPDVSQDFYAFRDLALPAEIRVKRAEGFAFYGVYPESYLQAASVLRGAGPVAVIGLRSIGTSLAAMVAVALDARTPQTLRPTGHPFRREVNLSPGLERRLVDQMDGAFAIVDEGPGLSGSSFGAVADWLEERGVSPERIRFFPSHGNDLGPQACPRHRRRWQTAARHVVDLDALILNAPRREHRLESWIEDLAGPLKQPLEDISGGGWRRHRFAAEQAWPPARGWQERRKFLAVTDRGRFLVKFAGLGREGERKLALARALHAANHSPEPLGLRYGFLVERWRDDLSPLDHGIIERSGFIEQIGAYLAFRAKAFPATAEAGATVVDLFAMAQHNVAEALGPETTRELRRFENLVPAIEQSRRPVHTDNRLHAWEWLQSRDGDLVKTDALDHHASHDLVGSQDIAWDVAGAAVEFDLNDAELSCLCRVVEAKGGSLLARDALPFWVMAYAAFQLGAFTMSASSAVGDAEETRRLDTAASRYLSVLRRVLV